MIRKLEVHLNIKISVMKNLKAATLLSCVSIFLFASCEKKVVSDNGEGKVSSVENAGSPKNASASAAEQPQDLPAKVNDFLKDHYRGILIAKYEMKNTLGKKEYEVKLDNGVEVEFDDNENWKKIKDYNGVPDILVPPKVKSYVNKNYKDIKIKSLDKKADRNMIEVDLLNGIELEFDMEGNFLRIDD